MQNWWILPKFAQKIKRNRLFFIDCFLAKFLPRNFPWNRPIFLRICPENPSKFDSFPLKSRKIGQFFCEFWLFSREISRFFREFALENPTKFCFFSAKYQKPCPMDKPEGLSPSKWFNPFSPNGDQHQFSPNNIHTSSREKVMRINKIITKNKCLDLLSNSLNTFFKKMYRNQFGEFVCGYWGLKG